MSATSSPEDQAIVEACANLLVVSYRRREFSQQTDIDMAALVASRAPGFWRPYQKTLSKLSGIILQIVNKLHHHARYAIIENVAAGTEQYEDVSNLARNCYRAVERKLEHLVLAEFEKKVTEIVVKIEEALKV